LQVLSVPCTELLQYGCCFDWWAQVHQSLQVGQEDVQREVQDQQLLPILCLFKDNRTEERSWIHFLRLVSGRFFFRKVRLHPKGSGFASFRSNRDSRSIFQWFYCKELKPCLLKLCRIPFLCLLFKTLFHLYCILYTWSFPWLNSNRSDFFSCNTCSKMNYLWKIASKSLVLALISSQPLRLKPSWFSWLVRSTLPLLEASHTNW